MSRRLILHIGNHKTGSTAVQKALYLNRDSLNAHGYELFYLSVDGIDREDGKPGLWIKPGKTLEQGSAIDARLAHEICQSDSNIIFSQENLSWIFTKSEIESFHRTLTRSFDDIQLIVYLRRQDQQAISHHQQAGRNYFMMASRFYGDQARSLPAYQPHLQLYLDYYRRISMWADVFGDKSVCIRIFDRTLLTNGDAVSDFFAAIGIPLDARQTIENKSKGFERTKVNHLMNQLRTPSRLRRYLNEYLDNTGKSMPSREEALAFYSHFRVSNRMLNERFEVTAKEYLFSDDFSMYAQDSQDIWSEQTANNALKNILNSFKAVPVLTDQDVELLRESAKELETIDAGLSKAFRNIIGES
ncbi:MAG: hypothetical protein DRQ56_04380 [Gammaproteobacteria bacterium]|nr:MAG: hypothetical protein DRQ56_04380 [Gammaproteobacteria bacterium]